MPEEINRIVTDAISDLLLVSEPEGMINLAREGRPAEKVAFVGNIMIDTLLRELPHLEQSLLPQRLGLTPNNYAYLSLHLSLKQN